LEQLAKFPAALAQTSAGQDVSRARHHYQSLATCNRRAQELLASKDPHRWTSMNELLDSAEAQGCDFATTSLGVQVETERRILRLAEENAKPAGAQQGKAEAEKAASLEKKHDLNGAEKAYKSALERDSFSLEALLGLARTAIEREQYAQAREHASRAERLDPV